MFSLLVAIQSQAACEFPDSNEPLCYEGKNLISAVQKFLRSRRPSDVTTDGLRAFLRDLSEKELMLPDFVQWPGEQFGALLDDLDGDGIPDVVLAQMVSEARAALYILTSRDSWAQSTTYNLQSKIHSDIRETRVSRLDLNGDGTKDVYVRFFEAGQRVASEDCLVVFDKSPWQALAKQCFHQDAASYEDQAFLLKQPSFSKLEDYQLSRLVDLNGDGMTEIVVTSYYIPKRDCGVNCWGIWPDVYAWDRDHYRLANSQFPGFYRGFRQALANDLRNKNSLAASDPSYRQTLIEMQKKVDEILRPGTH